MKIQPRSLNMLYKGRMSVLVTPVYIGEPIVPPREIKDPPETKFAAIWDTGATNTVVTEKVVKDCNLKPIGMAKVHTPKGESTSKVYYASVWLPNKVVIPQLRVTEGILHGGSEVLIGMDVINKGDFAVTNKDGKTNLSFRIPSVECIDFVKAKKVTSEPAKSQKISRNSPCPCGSGKKYKKCCGKPGK